MSDRNKPVFADIAAALGLLSRLPIPVNGSQTQRRGAASAWAWPVAGALIGACSGGIGFMALALGMPPKLAAGFVLATGAIITGGLHEDGLADTADGLWGGWTRERRLEIMKDSHIGSYGVIALILSFGLRWVALTAMFETGLGAWGVIGAAILSRAPMVVLSWRMTQARPGGLSASLGRPDGRTAALSVFVTLLMATPLLGLALVPAMLAVTLSTAVFARIAQAKIGGQTGDILGATQQLGEIAVLATLATLAI
ncbi:adenosylcobinamide-GDP ribazoletransferase [Oceaniglobus ichthyenteri]|uniref:adenosylcobinamide-GDP ribazoletransferase n=1 Tax=Oceaniglobus ichthyenteri TaxID=2136177 RepID=UPI000D3D79F8|nr:adenosylcobinamide-GDP ribazoletransferase [Oceaniglobus ichthyenteri]